MDQVKTRLATAAAVVALVLVLFSAPVSAATTAQFANGWSVNNDADWTPFPPNTAPLGAPNDFCTGGINNFTPGWAQFTFPGFGIPAGATLDGIEVRIHYLSQSGSNTLQLTKSGSLVGMTRTVASVTGSAACSNTAWSPPAGGPADDWGAGLTIADFNAGIVGFRLTQNANTVDIDAVEIIVHHTGGGGNMPPTAEANGPYAVNEGSSVLLSSAGSNDPDSDPLTFEWDLDNNGSFETAGASPSFSALDGPASQTVVLRVSDGVESATDTATVNISNVPPAIALSGSPSVDEGSSYALTLGAITDPGADTVTQWIVHWGDGDTDTFGSGGVKNHVYGDGPSSPTIEVELVDEDGTHDSGALSMTVDNVPPTITTLTLSTFPVDEGDPLVASATFTDPGADDSPFECTIDYGDGPIAGTVTGNSCTDPTSGHVYGDNGSFEVTVEVTDKDGGVGDASADAQVDNVAPTLTLDTAGAISFPGGDAFLGSQGGTQDHDAEGEDDGSDDLTFSWDFGPSTESTTYFNDTGDPSGSPDPFPSPDGTFPFSASDSGTVSFTDPGLYAVIVELEDDDGGVAASDQLAKIVTGDRVCARSQGFWRHQFQGTGKGKGKAHIDGGTLQAYLDIVDFASSVFSELVPAFDFASAQDVFGPGGSPFDKAARQALAAWLNFASGAIAVDEPIDLDGDSSPDTTFLALIATVENILDGPAPSSADLVLAKDFAEAVNLHDADTPGCD